MTFAMSQGIYDTVGEFGKPNPPAPFPAREGGVRKPLPASGRGLGRGHTPRSPLSQTGGEG